MNNWKSLTTRRTNKRWRYMGLLVLAVVVPLLSGLAGASPTQTTSDFVTIDAYITAKMQDSRLPGLALAIVQGNQVVHLKGFGIADPTGRPVTPQTPFNIASTGKSITALAIMQLVEAGQIDLDAPVQRYLPWFQVADPLASSQITVRHLLNHTSGISRVAGLAFVGQRNDSDDALEQRVRALRTAELSAIPGTLFQYSNANYSTLGMIVQTVSGQTYEQCGEIPAGFIRASAEDMAHYLVVHLNEGRYDDVQILSPAGIEELHRPAVLARLASGPDDGDEFYGMGWVVGTINGKMAVYHDGSGGNFHPNLVLLPQEKLGIVLLMNGENALDGRQIESIASGVTSLLVGRQPPVSSGAPMQATFLGYTFVVIVLQALSITTSFRTLHRWQAEPARRPSSWLRIGWHIPLPFMAHASLSFLLLVLVPRFMQGTLSDLIIFMPDFGYTLIFSGTIALIWAVLRTLLFINALRMKTGDILLFT